MGLKFKRRSSWEICTECHKSIDPASDYCNPHDYDCPNSDIDDDEEIEDCECGSICHKECCPECQCEGSHEKHWGSLRTCTGCNRRYCYAEGIAESTLCNLCAEEIDMAKDKKTDEKTHKDTADKAEKILNGTKK